VVIDTNLGFAIVQVGEESLVRMTNTGEVKFRVVVGPARRVMRRLRRSRQRGLEVQVNAPTVANNRDLN